MLADTPSGVHFYPRLLNWVKRGYGFEDSVRVTTVKPSNPYPLPPGFEDFSFVDCYSYVSEHRFLVLDFSVNKIVATEEQKDIICFHKHFLFISLKWAKK